MMMGRFLRSLYVGRMTEYFRAFECCCIPKGETRASKGFIMSKQPSCSESPPASSAAIPQLKALLRQTLRISVQDDRVFVGMFVGTDQLLNLLIVNAEEYRPQRANSNGRYIGQVLIPWSLITLVEVRENR
jgi:N-alpha-acetyltransferase 38, NatC auxiliary subunit